jgi:hypothetical protein
MGVMNSTANEANKLMKTLNFGIEIETAGTTRANLARAIQSVVGGTVTTSGPRFLVTDTRGRVWKVEPDGSLSGGELSGEVVSPILEYADMEQLQEIVRALRRHGARPDPSAAVHLHVDGRRLDARTAVNLLNIVHKQERLLESALRVSPTRLERYCKPIDPEFVARLIDRKPKTMEELSEAWYGYRNTHPERYHSSRYRGLNYNSLFVRGSVEFRIFESTLHAGEIKAYIQLVLAMTAKALLATAWYGYENRSPSRYCSTRYHGLNLNSLFVRSTVEYRLFNGSLHAGEIKAYVQLVLAMTAKALLAKSTQRKRRPLNPETSRYDFRIFLLQLGFVGPEFKSARHHLTKHLGGSSAWKGARRDKRKRAA